MSTESPVQPRQPEDAGAAPVWRPAATPGALPEDPGLRAWLAHRGSLTRRLQETGAEFSVEVMGQSAEPVDEDEARLLGAGPEPVPTRRVRLCCDGQALVYACTRIPRATLDRHPWLGELGNSPLGEAPRTTTVHWGAHCPPRRRRQAGLRSDRTKERRQRAGLPGDHAAAMARQVGRGALGGEVEELEQRGRPRSLGPGTFP